MANDDPSVFEVDAALEINEARMSNLESLGLDLDSKRVLDVGGGPGHLAQFFVQHGCDVLSIDGRAENTSALRATYPGLRAETVDVEGDDLQGLGRFDIVFAYGLLYHTTNPDYVIRNMARICTGLLLLESIILDERGAVCELVEDTPAINQGLRGAGCRPTPEYVVARLKSAGVGHVYAPKTPPTHPDFTDAYRADHAHARDGHNLRQIFVASYADLASPSLMELEDGSELFDHARRQAAKASGGGYPRM